MANAYWEEVVDPGDRASAFAKDICFQSHGNNSAVHIVPVEPDNFRGPVNFLWKRHILEEMLDHGASPSGRVNNWSLTESVEDDGAGGKLQFDSLLGTPEAFAGTGWEPITMTADDFARSGRFPVIIDNQADFKRITQQNFHLFQAMMAGYGEALKMARLINITGEVAIMKHSITAFCDESLDEQLILTWNASCIGLARKSMMIDWSEVGPGMPIVGFWEPGYRCNGGTFFTNVLLERWRNVAGIRGSAEAMEFVRLLTRPSLSYARLVNDLQGWLEDGRVRPPMARIYGIAHITGGGVWGKFREKLPAGVGADLDHMPAPADVLLQAQELSRGTKYHLSDYDAHGTLHGGCGMLMVCNPMDKSKIIRYAEDAYGVRAFDVGETTESPTREVRIQSQFLERAELSSDHPPKK
jgi:phosphoribosylaminoimidazole (AIR) synthetase